MLKRWLVASLLLAVSVGSLFVPAPAQAAGETFSWRDSTTIIMRGGITREPVLLRRSGANFTGAVTVNTQCSVNVTISRISATNAEGDLRGTADSRPLRDEFGSSYGGCPGNLLNGFDRRVNLGNPIAARDTATPQDQNAPGENTATPPPGEEEPTCDSGFVTWLICPAIELTASAISEIEQHVIQPFLEVKPLSTATNDTLYKVWALFRGLANAFFVIVFLMVIFSSATSTGLNAYNVKKMLPRLVAAAILVQFSYMISGLLVDIFNVLGKGLYSTLNDLLKDIPYNFANDTSEATTAGLLSIGMVAGAVKVLGATAAAALSGTLWLALATAFLGMLGVLVTLMFRQVVISTLIILSPLAFILWVLPNTEKFFKLWWSSFTKVLIMYPLIVLLFAAGKIFSLAAGASGGNLAPLFALVALIAPILLIPTTFKLAGAAMNFTGGMVGKLTNGGANKLRNSQGWKDAQSRAQNRRASLNAGQGVSVLGKNVMGGKKGAAVGRGLLGTGFRAGAAAVGGAAASRGGKTGAVGTWLSGQAAKSQGKSDIKADKAFNASLKAASDELELAGIEDNRRANELLLMDDETFKDTLQNGTDEDKALAQRVTGFRGSRAHSAAALKNFTKAGGTSVESRSAKRADPNGDGKESLADNVRAQFGDTVLGEQIYKYNAANLKDSNPELMYTDYHTGQLNRGALAKHLEGRDQAGLAKIKNDSWKTILADPTTAEAIKPEMLERLLSTSGASPAQNAAATIRNYLDNKPSVIPREVNKAILDAANGNLDHAVEMQQLYRSDAAVKAEFDQQLQQHGKIIAPTAPTMGPSAIPQHVGQKLIDQMGTEPNSLETAHWAYSNNVAGYRDQVNDAVNAGRPIPVPPSGPIPPPPGGPTPPFTPPNQQQPQQQQQQQPPPVPVPVPVGTPTPVNPQTVTRNTQLNTAQVAQLSDDVIAQKTAVQPLLNDHAAATGESVASLEQKYFSDDSFRHQVDTAKMMNVPVSSITPVQLPLQGAAPRVDPMTVTASDTLTQGQVNQLAADVHAEKAAAAPVIQQIVSNWNAQNPSQPLTEAQAEKIYFQGGQFRDTVQAIQQSQIPAPPPPPVLPPISQEVKVELQPKLVEYAAQNGLTVDAVEKMLDSDPNFRQQAETARISNVSIASVLPVDVTAAPADYTRPVAAPAPVTAAPSPEVQVKLAEHAAASNQNVTVVEQKYAQDINFQQQVNTAALNNVPVSSVRHVDVKAAGDFKPAPSSSPSPAAAVPFTPPAGGAPIPQPTPGLVIQPTADAARRASQKAQELGRGRAGDVIPRSEDLPASATGRYSEDTLPNLEQYMPGRNQPAPGGRTTPNASFRLVSPRAVDPEGDEPGGPRAVE